MFARRMAATYACVPVAAVSVLLPLEARQPPAARPAAAAHVEVVSRYCLSCHSQPVKRGGSALEAAAAHDVAQHPDIWEKVVRKMRARQMPPIGMPRPDAATYDAAVASLETALDRAAATSPNPGRTATLRRLTRTEYEHAI